MRKVFVLVTLVIMATYFGKAQANTEVINANQAINIDGSFQRQLTPAQKLKRLRKKLEKRNEILVKKQIETLRYKQEVELYKRMQAIFKQQMKNLENI